MTLKRSESIFSSLLSCFRHDDDSDNSDSSNNDSDSDSDDERSQHNFELEYAAWRARRYATARPGIPETLATLSTTSSDYSTTRATPHCHMSSSSPPRVSPGLLGFYSPSTSNINQHLSSSAVAALSVRPSVTRKPVPSGSRSAGPRYPEVHSARLSPPSRAHCKEELYSLPTATRIVTQYPPFSPAYCKDSITLVSTASAVRKARPPHYTKESMGNCFTKQDQLSRPATSRSDSLNMSTTSLDNVPIISISARQPGASLSSLERTAAQTAQNSHVGVNDVSVNDAIVPSSVSADEETTIANANEISTKRASRGTVTSTVETPLARINPSFEHNDSSAAGSVSAQSLFQTSSEQSLPGTSSSNPTHQIEASGDKAYGKVKSSIAGSSQNSNFTTLQSSSAQHNATLSANLTSHKELISSSTLPTTSTSSASLSPLTSSTAVASHPNVAHLDLTSSNKSLNLRASGLDHEMTSIGASTSSEHLGSTRVKRKRATECMICGNTNNVHVRFPSRKITSTCKHDGATCKTCLKTWISSQLDTVAWDQISCPEECAEIMQHNDVRFHASSAVFRRYDQLSLRSYLSADPAFQTCPAPRCGTGQLHPLGHAEPIFRCTACNTRSCIVCTTPWHEGRTCAQYQQDLVDAKDATAAAARRAKEKRDEEKASEALVKKQAKVCPGTNCGARIAKISGCDHMTCRRCRTEFCWLCQVDYKDIREVGNMAHHVGCKYRM